MANVLCVGKISNFNLVMDILTLDAALIDEFIEKQKDIKKTTMKVEIDLVAKIQKHGHDPKFQKLGEKLEELREKHEQGLITSIEFLKLLLELAKEAARAEKEVVPEEEIDRGKAALTAVSYTHLDVYKRQFLRQQVNVAAENDKSEYSL